MLNRHSFLLTLLLTVFCQAGGMDTGHGGYVSFGVRWGYEFGGTSTLTLKTGFGFFQYDKPPPYEEDGFPFRHFQSMSLGYRIRFGQEKVNYLFTDLQIGNIVSGVGAGMAILKNRRGQLRLAPRFSVFGGIGVWGTLDYVRYHSIRPDVGIQLVLPLPYFEGSTTPS